jgi:hypothetical protein
MGTIGREQHAAGIGGPVETCGDEKEAAMPKRTFAGNPDLQSRISMAGMKIVETVGERRNYDLQPEVTDFELWPFSTIEWVADQGKFRARGMVRHKLSGDIVAFTSWHADFADAERPVALLSDSLAGTGKRRVYNIRAETIDVHVSDLGGGKTINVVETLALTWSMQE